MKSAVSVFVFLALLCGCPKFPVEGWKLVSFVLEKCPKSLNLPQVVENRELRLVNEETKANCGPFRDYRVLGIRKDELHQLGGVYATVVLKKKKCHLEVLSHPGGWKTDEDFMSFIKTSVKLLEKEMNIKVNFSSQTVQVMSVEEFQAYCRK